MIPIQQPVYSPISPSGLFTLVNSTGKHFLTVHTASKNANAGMWVVPRRGQGKHQEFTFDNGRIVTFCDLVLGVRGDAPTAGSKVVQQQRRDIGTQRWELHNDGTVRIAGTYMCLDHVDNCVDEQTNLLINPYNGSHTQKWTYAPVDTSTQHKSTCPAYNPQGEKYLLVSDLNGLVLDVKGNSSADKTGVHTWKNNGQDNQKFSFQNGMIYCVHSGKVLTVDSPPGNYSNVVQMPPTGAPNQQWELHNDSTIRLANTSLCLDIQGENKEQGAHVFVYAHHGRANQKWRLVK
jgi:hypothetical protein